MPKVHEDKHGVCLKVGGYVWRPIFPAGLRAAAPKTDQTYSFGQIFSVNC